jgi:signal transduction histidine kinase
VDQARTLRGAGLGLSIAKKIIEVHQGSIEVVSVPHQGSNFKVILPHNDT